MRRCLQEGLRRLRPPPSPVKCPWPETGFSPKLLAPTRQSSTDKTTSHNLPRTSKLTKKNRAATVANRTSRRQTGSRRPEPVPPDAARASAPCTAPCQQGTSAARGREPPRIPAAALDQAHRHADPRARRKPHGNRRHQILCIRSPLLRRRPIRRAHRHALASHASDLSTPRTAPGRQIRQTCLPRQNLHLQPPLAARRRTSLQASTRLRATAPLQCPDLHASAAPIPVTGAARSAAQDSPRTPTS